MPPFAYRSETACPEGFVQHVACNLLPHGYVFFVSGWVPGRKDPASVDRKILAKYGIAVSPQTRHRRKLAGLANLHYLRCGQQFLILATHGRHEFFADEAGQVRDARKVPISFRGYSIRVVPGGHLRNTSPEELPAVDPKQRVRVQVGREAFRGIQAEFLNGAASWSVEEFGRRFYSLPFEPYAPVRQQLLNLLRRVNQRRAEARLDKIPPTVIRYRRKIVKPFDTPQLSDAAGDTKIGI